jgi:hypothetical protein
VHLKLIDIVVVVAAAAAACCNRVFEKMYFIERRVKILES